MLHLKRVIYDYEFMKCGISGDLIGYGDFYYEDDEDGLIVKASTYNEIMDKRKEELFDYSKLERARSEREYQQMLKRAERELLEQTLFERKIFNKEVY